MFSFYLKVYRTGLIGFCGSKIEIEYDLNSSDGKIAFKEYENGLFKKTGIPKTCHTNVLYGVLMGKKGIGLWLKEWSLGISEWSFTKEEIINEFTIRGIEIPDSIMIEFDNLINKMKLNRYS